MKSGRKSVVLPSVSIADLAWNPPTSLHHLARLPLPLNNPGCAELKKSFCFTSCFFKKKDSNINIPCCTSSAQQFKRLLLHPAFCILSTQYCWNWSNSVFSHSHPYNSNADSAVVVVVANSTSATWNLSIFSLYFIHIAWYLSLPSRHIKDFLYHLWTHNTLSFSFLKTCYFQFKMRAISQTCDVLV